MLELLSDWPVRMVFIAVMSGLAVCGLTAISRRARPDREGWRRIGPGASLWFGLILGTVLLSIFIYVRLFVGSARSDAERQMMILTVLILGLGAMVVYLLYECVRIRRRAIEWRGRELRFRAPGGAIVHRTFDDISGIERVGSSGWRLHVDRGCSVHFSEAASGAMEFVEALLSSGVFCPARR